MNKEPKITSTPLGQGFFALAQDGTPRGIETRDVPKLRELVGDQMLVAFVQAFHGAERLDTFVHLISLNYEAQKGGVAWNRNHRTLVFLIYGTLHESMDALTHLHTAGVERASNNSDAWKRLNEMRKRWARDPFLGNVRNAVAHHLGDFAEIRDGLAKFANGEPMMMFESDGAGTWQDSAIPFAVNAVLGGMAFDSNSREFNEFVKTATTDAMAFGNDLQRVLSAVLLRHGVNLG